MTLKSGHDATRRNRNIGTSKSGHGQNNRLVISICDPDAFTHYESIKSYTAATREINSKQMTFIVEKTRAGSYHACTVDDITHVLHQVPGPDVDGIELIVLRQPKRKEEILSPVWGRLGFFVEIGRHRGCAIFIETINFSKPLRLSKSMGPEVEAELQRLAKDGHEITTTRRHHVVSSSLESVRATQLYRTLLHELGHHVDCNRNPNAFDRKTTLEKEVFAHRYADALQEELRRRKVIPFTRILEPKRIEQDGLQMSDFSPI